MRIHRRGVLPVLLLLVLVLVGTVVQVVRGPAAVSRPLAVGRAATPAPPSRQHDAVVRSLAAVEQAFNAGDVRLLCRSGALVDPAVIQRQNARPGGCESELERLMANEPRLRLAVRGVTLRRDLATVAVGTASGAGASVDLVRHGRRWLLSFSDGNDPMPALAGTT